MEKGKLERMEEKLDRLAQSAPEQPQENSL